MTASELHRRDLADILDALPSLVAFVDEDGRNRYANRAAEAWLGRSATELRGQPIREILGEDDYGHVQVHVDAALRGQTQSFTRTLRLPGGTVVHTLTDYVACRRGGRPRGFTVLVTDITRQVEAEAAERAALLRSRAAVHATDTVLQELFAVGLHLERLRRASAIDVDGAAELVNALGSTIDRLRESIKALIGAAPPGPSTPATG